VAILAAWLLSAPVFAADSACQPVFDAAIKMLTIPAHLYSTATLPGGKTRASETIYVNGAIYVNYNGQWKRSKMTAKDMLEQEHENIRDSKTTCRHVRDESVNGEAASLYTEHSENDSVISDAQTWISKSKGAPLHTEEDLDTGQGDKQHVSIRYEYSNVRPPAGVP
jgi:hypothetical protein